MGGKTHMLARSGDIHTMRGTPWPRGLAAVTRCPHAVTSLDRFRSTCPAQRGGATLGRALDTHRHVPNFQIPNLAACD